MPVIFLTSKDDEVDEALGLRIGADDYISKPFEPRELLLRIKNVIKSNNKNIPLDLINLIKNYLDELSKSTSNLSKKKYIFDNNIDDLMIHEKDLVNKILFNLQRHLILCEKNTGNWSVENINDIVIGKTKPYDFKDLDEGLPIMCTKNNNLLGISNGDIGVLIGINENRKYLFRLSLIHI